MGLFDFLKPKKDNRDRFVTETAFQKNLSSQMRFTPQTMEQLRIRNVSADKEFKLEFFFYTDQLEKAKLLAEQLEKLEYSVEYQKAAAGHAEFVITGWTTKIKMEDDIVANWTKEMCELGYQFDCDFDGWGTSVDQ